MQSLRVRRRHVMQSLTPNKKLRSFSVLLHNQNGVVESKRIEAENCRDALTITHQEIAEENIAKEKMVLSLTEI